MRKFAAALFAVIAAAATRAQTPAPPKLAIVISVDQFSTDLLDEYRSQFTGGLGELARGTMFPNGVEGPSTPTIGDLLKQRSPASLDVAVAGDGSAATRSGHTADQLWHWNGRSFVTNLAETTPPASVAITNQAVARLVAQPEPPFDPPPFCQGKASGVPGSNSRFQRAAGDYTGFTASPGLDGATLALAAHLVQELRLGQHKVPDLLAISLSATGNVARQYGPAGQAMCLNLLSLDRDLGGFLQVLDEAHLDYAVILEGSGATRVPILFWRAGMAPALREQTVSTADLAPTLAAMIGLAAPRLTSGHCLTDVQDVLCPTK